ncbi:hypothetical protein [Streptomyces sp. NBC_00557]|uniref:hypothetical protein n=1 Tax=Streptomyces sp. NBC_00557 TaxID=2975776 RepID=UPI002E7FFEB2|nr:hypothetical protein [Streptomyces sp. NBC_00557]WUC40152.1 hypothetical protein OG956_38955 [Streptomyces sp. NBC_00557]
MSADESVAALRALHRLNLVDHTPDAPHRAVRIHSLIQRSVRETLSSQQQDSLARVAADALIAAWLAVERDVALDRALRDNAQVLQHLAGTALFRPDADEVLFRTGSSLGASGQMAASLTHSWSRPSRHLRRPRQPRADDRHVGGCGRRRERLRRVAARRGTGSGS